MSFEMQDMWQAMKGPYYQRLLSELRDGMNKSENLQEVFTLALEQIAKAAHAEAGTLWIHDKFTDGRIRPYAVHGGNSEIGNFSLPYGEGVCGKVIQSGESVRITTGGGDGAWAKKADVQTGFSTKSMICVPIKRGRSTFGCIQILNKTDGMDFDEMDIAFADELANEFSIQFIANDYMAGYENTDIYGNIPKIDNSMIGFAEILSQKEFADVEETLRMLPAVRTLNERMQKQVLRHSREIWLVMRKTK